MQRRRLPEWLRRPPGGGSETAKIKRLLRKSSLNTVCEEARCPNISECFSRATATFMILGDVCTRGCRFCSVNTGKPAFSPLQFKAEGQKVARAVVDLGLKHVVVTSVARDDLEDGGASGFSTTIDSIRSSAPGVVVEVLIPDFRGSSKAILEIVKAKPDIVNHNLETVPRLYRKVRPGSSYQRSLKLLKEVKNLDKSILTKTGIMLGLGEKREEVEQLMSDSRKHKIDIFTAGQYMQPTKDHLGVEEFIEPKVFDDYRDLAEEVGFIHAACGPLVRSSYHADNFSSKFFSGSS